jgi:hypothetical protein
VKPPAIPTDEPERLRALAEYHLLDTPSEASFDALTRLAAHLVDAPVALITLVDAERQWFKSRHGLAARETARDVSFCGHVVADRQPLVVPDASRDERFADNPLVTGEPHIRFYAGLPLVGHGGHVLGTLCVIDRVPRELTAKQQELLALLTGQVVDQLEARRQARQLRDEHA